MSCGAGVHCVDRSKICLFCGGVDGGTGGAGCTCREPPEPECSWSETSSDGSLDEVVDIGYRDPAHEYDYDRSEIDVMVGDMAEMSHGHRVGGEEWGVVSEGALLGRTFRCGDLGFAEPLTRERPAGRVGVCVRKGRAILMVGLAEMVVTRMSELPTQSWYETSTRSWPSWISWSREMYQAVYAAEEAGLVTLVSREGDRGPGAILIDVPLPWYGGRIYRGQELVSLSGADIWQWTAEHRRGDYGPLTLIERVMVPAGFVPGQRCVFDTNPTANNNCFMRSGKAEYESGWELVQLSASSKVVGVPVWAYRRDLWDCSRKSIWLDRRSIDKSRDGGLGYVIIGRDNMSGYVCGWADEDLTSYADVRLTEQTQASGYNMPPVEAEFRIWYAMWNKAGRIKSLGDIVDEVRASEEAVLIAGQDPRRFVPYLGEFGCYFRLYRSSPGQAGGAEIDEVSVEVLKRCVVACDSAGYCVSSLGQKRLEVGRRHVGPVRVGKGSRFSLISGKVGRQEPDMYGIQSSDFLPAECEGLIKTWLGVVCD